VTSRPEPGEIRALGIIGTASASSRTRALVDAVLDGASATGSVTSEVVALGTLELAIADATRADDRTGDTRELLVALDRADVVVIGTPIHRATYSALTKAMLDLVPRGTYDGSGRPLEAKPTVLVATAAVPEHFLGLEHLTAILHSFFAALVIPPGVFASPRDFSDDGTLAEPLRRRAEQAGQALVELHRALPDCPALASVTPQI